MSRKIVGPSSLFGIPLTKYILRKDVFFAKSILIERDITTIFEEPPDNIGDEDGPPLFELPGPAEDFGDANSPVSFINALIEPAIPRINEKKREEFFLYKNFFLGMDLNPNFYRYIVNKTKNIRWIKNHRSELAYLLLLDILSEKAPTILEANIEFREDYKDEDRTRQRRLLRNEYYPELFFKPALLIERNGDERVGNYSTLITEELKFGEEHLWSFQLMMALNQQFLNNLPPQRDDEWWDYHHACIKLVSADEVRDILDFGYELNEVLDRVLLRVSGLMGDRKLIVEEIRRKTDIIEQFRSLLNIAVYVRWFNLKTLNARRKLIEKKRRLKYTESEAQQIVPLLMEYCNDPELASAYIYFGARAFTALGKPKYAELLKNERRKLICITKDTHE